MIETKGKGPLFSNLRKSLESNSLRLERFTWNKDDGTLSAFESDLRDRKFDGRYPWLQRLYDDACDVGCVITSAKTGVSQVFYLTDQMESEGDILGWTFAPLDETSRVKKVTIFND